jgi:hypothetical protein
MHLKRFAAIRLLAIWFILAGCTATGPYEYENDRDQKPGPGLFSGQKGAFIIYESPKPKTENDTTEETSQTDAGEAE